MKRSLVIGVIAFIIGCGGGNGDVSRTQQLEIDFTGGVDNPVTESIDISGSEEPADEQDSTIPEVNDNSQYLQEADYVNSRNMTFNRISAGTFSMGSPITETFGEDASMADRDEFQHDVTLTDDFYIQTTEVTQAQWQAVMGSMPSFFSGCGDDCPVENVSWNDVNAFIDTLNTLEEGVYRLPTEAEWEYAARAGSTTAFESGDPVTNFDDIPDDVCLEDENLDVLGWYCNNADNSTHPVARKSPNNWGLYDMHGNVWEWCRDWYGAYPKGWVANPIGPTNGSARVIRGGGYMDLLQNCRSAFRYQGSPESHGDGGGFRLVFIPENMDSAQRDVNVTSWDRYLKGYLTDHSEDSVTIRIESTARVSWIDIRTDNLVMNSRQPYYISGEYTVILEKIDPGSDAVFALHGTIGATHVACSLFIPPVEM